MEDEREMPPAGDQDSSDEDTIKGDREEDHIVEILEEERQTSATPVPIGNGSVAQRYRALVESQAEVASEDGSADGLPRRAGSPVESLLSVPDRSPSVQGSLISSPSSSVLPSVASRPGLNSPTPSFRPFDRRFQSRISSPSIFSSRPSSPAFLAEHRRSTSLSSNLLLDPGENDTPSPPWEVVRWTKLRKLNGQAFSEVGRRNFGSPTCIAVSATIVLGTSKGIILMFDYNQNLKMIIGPGTKAAEAGAVTAVAVSADHSTVAGGHANGSIFTWDTNRAARPFLQIPHLDASQTTNRTVDGHMPNVAITNLGFLGTRHTALVSADDRGMAFAHLATRGTGALGRTVKTTRILGRYPGSKPPSGKPTKPSTVLAFAPLPLGNLERATDTMGLTAMLTPYLLVIVSTTPVAETQHKSPRPKEIAPHSAMSGCLAWFPAVKLKVPDQKTGSQISRAKLVYCWSNVLTVLDVNEIPAEDKDKPPTLGFKARNRWKCEEAIVAVQWMSRSVLTILTISQRLIVLEDHSMRVTEAFDLIHKHIYHVDLFSKQLHSLVEQLDEEDTSMHGVVADAFSMSFKAYKGRIFLLGFNDVSIGALSNWADRLIALMENGDYVGAIHLANSFYTGDADKLTVGLPEDTTTRHSMVRERLIEIMSASLKYAFGRRQKGSADADDNHLRELGQTCFTACESIEDTEFLFEEMYEWYEDAEVEGIFLEILEPYILDETITIVPPAVVKAIISHFVSKGLQSRLEEMICHMNTATLDLDQVTLLCKQHGLYDALIYVWNQALKDFISPLIDLLALLVPLMQNGEYDASGNVMEQEIYDDNAQKIFQYLSCALTGRSYPTRESLDEKTQLQAKAELYWFLFSGKSITWPKGTAKRFLTRPNLSEEPSFPYLRLILKFDAPSFLSALNEAFEDAFLNDSSEKQLNGSAGKDLPEEQIFGLTVDRQYVVSILTEIMNPADFAPADTIYLDMFIARNLPMYPQYLLLPESTLNRVLSGLCHYPGADLADDAQLSAEYLLSVYHPPDISGFIPLFKEAGFFRILKRTYRDARQYGKLLQAYFDDPEDRQHTFACIRECFGPQVGLTKRQVQEVHKVIKSHARELVELDTPEAARTIGETTPELHRDLLESVEDEPSLQHLYLKTLLEPEDASPERPPPDRDLIEQYVRLMCRFEPSHVSNYVGLVQSANLRLDRLLPTMEETGVVDAAVVLMAQEGEVHDAMNRLIKHLQSLQSALKGLLGSKEDANDVDVEVSVEDLLNALQKYIHVGIWLCRGQTKTSKKTKPPQKRGKSSKSAPEELSTDEKLWLNLIEIAVQVTRQLSPAVQALPRRFDAADAEADRVNGDIHRFDTDKLVTLLRSLVQHTFTALLTTTSSTGAPQTGPRTISGAGGDLSFLRILRAFLNRAAAVSPNLADLRAVLTSIFSAYAYEEALLTLSNRLLEESLFANVQQAVELRQRGWRTKGSTCEYCRRRVWGPGVQGNIYEAWEQKQAADGRRRAERKALASGAAPDRGKGKDNGGGGEAEYAGKGKGKQSDVTAPQQSPVVGPDQAATKHPTDGAPDGAASSSNDDSGQPAGREQNLGPLVIFACRHVYHQNCLEALQAQRELAKPARGYPSEPGRERDYRCPIDG
jgi:vacuolar protein sorting-associated protein 8